MRIGGNSTPRADGFVGELDGIHSGILEGFSEKMNALIRPVPVKVMLGDATVTEQSTFDPAQIRDYFREILRRLPGWTVRDLTVTNNEDVRRVFSKFETRAGNYVLSGHVSIQFHVLLYYRTDHRVVAAQKELSEIIGLTKEKEAALAEGGDRLVMKKLEELGYADLDHERLFEVLFENGELRERIHSEIYGGADEEFQRMESRKRELFDELDGLLVETYQTSPVMIDEARLVTGEEGYLCTFDLEFVKGGSREGAFDTRKMPPGVRREIRDRLAEFERTVRKG